MITFITIHSQLHELEMGLLSEAKGKEIYSQQKIKGRGRFYPTSMPRLSIQSQGIIPHQTPVMSISIRVWLPPGYKRRQLTMWHSMTHKFDKNNDMSTNNNIVDLFFLCQGLNPIRLVLFFVVEFVKSQRIPCGMTKTSPAVCRWKHSTQADLHPGTYSLIWWQGR